MNSTRLLIRFFNRFIIPTSNAIKGRMAQKHGKNLLGVDTLSDSSYHVGPFGPDFIETRTEDFTERLELIWLDNDQPELALLAKPVVDLAAALRENEIGKDKSISETSYELY